MSLNHIQILIIREIKQRYKVKVFVKILVFHNLTMQDEFESILVYAKPTTLILK